MRKWIKISLLVLLIPFLLLGAVLINDLVFKNCGLEESWARNRVYKELNRHDMNTASLILEKSVGTCTHVYKYKTEEKHIDYIVFSTWLHGVKLNQWDYYENN